MRSAASALARRALATTAPLRSSSALAQSSAGACPHLTSTRSAAAASAALWPAVAGRGAAAPLSLRGFASAAGPPDDASHDDFKPTFASGDGAAPASAADVIKADIEAHRVFVYMKV